MNLTQRVLNHIQNYGPCTSEEVHNSISGYSRDSVKWSIYQLRAKGKVKTHKRGKGLGCGKGCEPATYIAAQQEKTEPVRYVGNSAFNLAIHSMSS